MSQLIGTAPNQVPTNGDLGTAAYMDTSAFYGTGLSASFRNRIINGDMRIDQRNVGASVAQGVGQAYTLDRWAAYAGNSLNGKFNVQQVADAPAGFYNSLKVTTASVYTPVSNDYFSVAQQIEGYNFADFGFGTSSAVPVTISFWVKSSVAGTHGGSLHDSTETVCFAFSYTINAANTWEYKTITIPGYTGAGGTWNKTNGSACFLWFGLGAGPSRSISGMTNQWSATQNLQPRESVSILPTSGATWQITGVQLERGAQATPFEFRPYGMEVVLCQRYYEKSFDIGTIPSNGGATAPSTTSGMMSCYSTNSSYGCGNIVFKVHKRAIPTMTPYGNSSGYWYAGSWGVNAFSVSLGETGGVVNQQQVGGFAQTFGHWVATAEL